MIKKEREGNYLTKSVTNSEIQVKIERDDIIEQVQRLQNAKSSVTLVLRRILSTTIIDRT